RTSGLRMCSIRPICRTPQFANCLDRASEPFQVRPFVEISDVSLTYPGAGANATLALEHATLSIDQGEFVAVVGPSGCGKSTLLKLVSGLHLPTRGGVIVANRE